MLDIGLAFLEGIGLILSPCIFPVLPLVLASSLEGGKARPYGVITGFVLSFILFALMSRYIVTAIGFDLDIIKNVSLFFLAVLGIILIVPKFSEIFSSLAQRTASFGAEAGGEGGGFLSGILVGALIGLVWTPCAGPILAVVLVQVIRQQTDLKSYMVITSFALGAGVPMLIITLLGRKIMRKIRFLAQHLELIRRSLGAIILISVAYIAFGSNVQSLISSSSPQSSPLGLQKELKMPYKAPKFFGISAWLNSSPLTMESLRGKVVLVDFWTYSCINCVRTLPYLTSWYQKYHKDGLVIVGVHSPEFEFEKKKENVEKALQTHNIQYPVALDNELQTWAAFDNHYWPAHYLINKDGHVVYTHFGEGDYDVTENNIRYLLGHPASYIGEGKGAQITHNQTPETYLGISRADRFESLQALSKGEGIYTFPEFIPLHHWALKGVWKIGGQKITSYEKGASLRLNFLSRKVFLVLGPSSNTQVRVKLLLNGQPLTIKTAGKDVKKGEVIVKAETLYELINQETPANGILEIVAEDPGLDAYAFTFG